MNLGLRHGHLHHLGSLPYRDVHAHHATLGGHVVVHPLATRHLDLSAAKARNGI